jgi:tRNA modification GTPase
MDSPLGERGGRFYYRRVVDGDGRTVDDVVAAVFRAPHSYTGEDTVEISCHGSRYIQQKILQLLVNQGVRLATAGEFTMRALLNGRLDLAQAEAVADVIASESRMSHALAVNQMRGGYSQELRTLRDELVRLASLLELELDFGEEDVEFADRADLQRLITFTREKIERLAGSFAVGNVLKQGVAVAIVGSPNVGKSTLLNALVGDDRAMVSDIAGTTRDTLEERVDIDGLMFRFVDTAGLRDTDDRLELMGIERARAAVERADVVLLVVEAGASDEDVEALRTSTGIPEGRRTCVLVNKIDTNGGRLVAGDRGLAHEGRSPAPAPDTLYISARRGDGLDDLRAWLVAGVDSQGVRNGDAVVSNARHHEALTHASAALAHAEAGLLAATPPDLLAQDIREALHHLGLITGEITTDDILTEIFSKFCIGK